MRVSLDIMVATLDNDSIAVEFKHAASKKIEQAIAEQAKIVNYEEIKLRNLTKLRDTFRDEGRI